MNVVTGAFSYTGKYIARRLLAEGQPVRTLTSHPDRPDPFGGRVKAFPLDFQNPDELRRSLSGATTLYNTYWVRFPHGGANHDAAVANTKVLFQAAKDAGVRRIIHVSITGANPTSRLSYFRGKGLVERALTESGLGYAILRPTVVFGDEDILINNIAWFLRRFAIFPIPGSGRYLVQPVFVGDMAGLAVRGGQEPGNVAWDAAGPERYMFLDLVRLVRKSVGSRATLVPASPFLALALSKLLGAALRDVVLTRDEVVGLMEGLLVTHEPSRGTTSLKQWLEESSAAVGADYKSELRQHY